MLIRTDFEHEQSSFERIEQTNGRNSLYPPKTIVNELPFSALFGITTPHHAKSLSDDNS